MTENFQAIANGLADKKLQKTALSLREKYKPTVAKELERASSFAYELFFQKQEEASLKIIDIIARENFNGNHNLWTWIQAALLLKCWILKNKSQDSNYENLTTILTIITDTENFGTDEILKSIRRKAKNRRLSGGLLHYDSIETAIKSHDKHSEMEWRKAQFSELLFIYFLGGSEEFSQEKALREIHENLELLQQTI